LGKGTSVIIGLIMVAVMMVIFPIVMESAHELQTDSYTHTEAGVTTGAGVTAANVVLDEAVWDDSTSHITSITSDEVTDVPVAGTYTAATKTLNVTGLAESDSRTLTIVYEYDGLEDYTGMGAMAGVAPLLIFIGVLGVVMGGLYTSFKGR